jgi:hypothetical protein
MHGVGAGGGIGKIIGVVHDPSQKAGGDFPINSQLIQGSQSLFGIKTQLQFGRLMVTSVYSQTQSKAQQYMRAAHF